MKQYINLIILALLFGMMHMQGYKPEDSRKAKKCAENHEPCNLPGADLSKDTLAWGDLRHANLRGANLAGTTFFQMHLQNADLSNADLRKASFEDSDLSEANFRFADLRRANFKFSHYSDTADVRGARIDDSTKGINIRSWKKRGAIYVSDETPITTPLHTVAALLSTQNSSTPAERFLGYADRHEIEPLLVASMSRQLNQ